ncbi:MAG: nucleoside hydrolase [Bacteroidales bacterium]
MKKHPSCSLFTLRTLALFLIFIQAGFSLQSQPLQTKFNHRIIIDTDCAIDDMRAISYLIARPEITIQAIILSDGSLTPADGLPKIRALMHGYNRDSLPVAVGLELPGVNPPWREFNKNLMWGKEKIKSSTAQKANECLAEQLKTASEKITLVCLGPLSNIALVVRKSPELLKKIDRLVWYNESVYPLKGFNYECDTLSAKIVLSSGLRIDIVSNLRKEDAAFDLKMLDVCEQSNTLLARGIAMVHKQKEAFSRLSSGHFRLCDDLVALYLTNPELFNMNLKPANPSIRYCEDFNEKAIRSAFEDMLKGTYVAEKNVVFNQFPAKAELFNYDVRLILDTAIARYGNEEWKANVMTDEFHGHLGVFSIVGAKMGIRAREYFGVGPDMLNVKSFAGSRPPYSCLNDGIQVSTGATLGMGTIELITGQPMAPAAIFSYKGRSIKISLKEEYLKMVNDDINEGILKFGLMDEGYWKLIRQNALKYWVEWDRNRIFDISTLTP